MRAPQFWWCPQPTTAARLLAPISTMYGAVTAARMARAGESLAVPVLCVGNLVAGGAGKTPTAMTLARLLRQIGHRPAFVSRGYGRRVQARQRVVLAVDPARDTAEAVGDEPLLLARVAPTFVGADRIAAGREAIAQGASIIVLDDGLQSPDPRKDLALAVVDGGTGVGNGLCVPAGPLRAPLKAQWPHVGAVCVIGRGEAGEHVARQARDQGLTVWRATLEPTPAVVEQLRGGPLLAFAGIGHPPKFFLTLAMQGLAIAATRSFPDHHRYRAGDLQALEHEARRLGARLVTTDKDQTRLPPGFAVETLRVDLVFEDETAVSATLLDALSVPPPNALSASWPAA